MWTKTKAFFARVWEVIKTVLPKLWTLPDYVQHCILAAVIMLLAKFVLDVLPQPVPYTWPISAAFGIVWFHGREQADADSVNRGLLDNFLAWIPWKWHWDSQKDFYAPLASNTLIAGFMHWWTT